MRRWLALLAGLIALVSVPFAPVAAQEATPEASPAAGIGIAPAFSNELLPTLGYPELTLRETGSGLEGVPDELPAGRYLVALEAPADSPAYVDFVQVPTGLSQAEEQLLLAAAGDVAQEGWVYGGGSYALPDMVVHFVVELAPGDWHVAATRESVPPAGGELREWATLHPLRVTAAAASPVASPMGGEPAVAATLEMRDVAFGGLGGTVAAGPQVWKVTNVGEQPRQLVLFRTPRLLTADDFRAMMMGTPAAGAPSREDLVWAGYVAILSPGQSVWIEFDLEPGTYAATSFVEDVETGMPAVLLGMIHGFTVE